MGEIFEIGGIMARAPNDKFYRDLFARVAEINMTENDNKDWGGLVTLNKNDYAQDTKIIIVAVNDFMVKDGLRLGDEGSIIYQWDKTREVSIQISREPSRSFVVDPLYIMTIADIKVPSGAEIKVVNDSRVESQHVQRVVPQYREALEYLKDLPIQRFVIPGNNPNLPLKEHKALISEYALNRLLNGKEKIKIDDFHIIVGKTEKKWLTLPGWDKEPRQYTNDKPYTLDFTAGYISPNYYECIIEVEDEKEFDGEVELEHQHTHEKFKVIQRNASGSYQIEVDGHKVIIYASRASKCYRANYIPRIQCQ